MRSGCCPERNPALQRKLLRWRKRKKGEKNNARACSASSSTSSSYRYRNSRSPFERGDSPRGRAVELVDEPRPFRYVRKYVTVMSFFVATASRRSASPSAGSRVVAIKVEARAKLCRLSVMDKNVPRTRTYVCARVCLALRECGRCFNATRADEYPVFSQTGSPFVSYSIEAASVLVARDITSASNFYDGSPSRDARFALHLLAGVYS